MLHKKNVFNVFFEHRKHVVELNADINNNEEQKEFGLVQ